MFNHFVSTHTEAEVQQEEHVERHVDLQREVFVEVLTGLDRTIRQRHRLRLSSRAGTRNQERKDVTKIYKSA